MWYHQLMAGFVFGMAIFYFGLSVYTIHKDKKGDAQA